MREIKFRAWLKGIGRMSYTHTLEELMNWDTKKEDNGTAIWLQYTELNDKNGIEIYEGDICEVEYKSGKKFNNEIRFLNAAFTFRSYYLHRVAEDVLDEFCTIKVVGNIYENPELLES